MQITILLNEEDAKYLRDRAGAADQAVSDLLVFHLNDMGPHLILPELVTIGTGDGSANSEVFTRSHWEEYYEQLSKEYPDEPDI